VRTYPKGLEEISAESASPDIKDANLGRRNLLRAGPAVAASPVLGAALAVELTASHLAKAEASQKASPFVFAPDREIKSAARTMALESLLIEKGIITENTIDNVLSFFETQMGPFNEGCRQSLDRPGIQAIAGR
jgi:hypothetical protein